MVRDYNLLSSRAITVDFSAGTALPRNQGSSVRRILRSAQLRRSATVNRRRNGFAATIMSRVVRPLASAPAIVVAASAYSGAVSTATAPAPPAKCER